MRILYIKGGEYEKYLSKKVGDDSSAGFSFGIGLDGLIEHGKGKT